MSGIHGILRLDGGDVAVRALEGQSRALAHRGRDRRNIWQDGPIGLGHLLNRITVEDAFDDQPLADPSGVTAVADVRIDNREELAVALSVAPEELGRMADSALLLRAYLHWGDNFIVRMIGDFAFAIWDRRSRKLVLGRDHVGQRHVFFHRGDGFFAFASEPRGLWALPEVPRRLSFDFVGARMIFAPRLPGTTQFDGICAIEGGTIMTVAADGRVSTRRYWEPVAAPEHLNRDDAYYIEAYRRTLTEAVDCRVRRTTRPAGLLLGGGFDSGSIAALAGPTVTAQKRKLIATSSVMPKGDRTTPRNARRWVEYLARDLPHLDVRYVTREGVDIFTNIGRDFLTTDGLRGPSRYAYDMMMREVAAAGARTLMDGNGGDYTLNPRSRQAPLRILRREGLRRFLHELRVYSAASGLSYPRLLVREIALPLLPDWISTPFNRLRRRLAPFSTPVPVAQRFLRELAAAGINSRPAPRSITAADENVATFRAITRLQSGPVMGGALHAAAHGLELTLPFHDKRVVELALAIPDHLVFKDGRDRYLARRALADVLPRELLKRGSANDDATPDFCDMIRHVEPAVLAEIDRMEKERRMTRYFDFARMRRMLTGNYGLRRGRRTRAAVEHATRSFLHARYIEWFQRDNYSEDDKT